MLKTIVTASHISVQGEFVRQLADGRIMVRVGQTYYVGRPVEAAAEGRADPGLSVTA